MMMTFVRSSKRFCLREYSVHNPVERVYTICIYDCTRFNIIMVMSRHRGNWNHTMTSPIPGNDITHNVIVINSCCLTAHHIFVWIYKLNILEFHILRLFNVSLNSGTWKMKYLIYCWFKNNTTLNINYCRFIFHKIYYSFFIFFWKVLITNFPTSINALEKKVCRSKIYSI